LAVEQIEEGTMETPILAICPGKERFNLKTSKFNTKPYKFGGYK